MKLNDDEVRTIRELVAGGVYSFAEAARYWGVSKSTIQGIMSGRTWAHAQPFGAYAPDSAPSAPLSTTIIDRRPDTSRTAAQLWEDAHPGLGPIPDQEYLVKYDGRKKHEYAAGGNPDNLPTISTHDLEAAA